MATRRSKARVLLFSLILALLLLNTLNIEMYPLEEAFAFLGKHLHLPTSFVVNECSSKGVTMYNASDYKYLVNNPRKCSGRNPMLLIFVKTLPSHIHQRDAIRRTWGNVSTWKIPNQFQVIVLFMLGVLRQNSTVLQEEIEEENKEYNDIIQENFVENFYNLTLKVVGQLKWVSKFCNCKYFMTTDDDVFVHVGNLMSYISKHRSESLYTGCVHSGSAPQRNPASKYFVPSIIYPGLYYPDYCPGAGYLLSHHAVLSLYSRVSDIPLLYIDDVYMGLLAHAAGIQPRHVSSFYCEQKVYMDPCFLNSFITSHGYTPQELIATNNAIKSRGSEYLCWLKTLLHSFT